MRRLYALIVAALCVFSACSGSEVHFLSRNDLPADLYPQGARKPDPRNAQVTLYMLEGNRLAPVSRTGRSDLSPPELVLRALLSGPTKSETAMGLTTALPAAVELIGAQVEQATGVAEVDFNGAFDTPVREEMLRRVAQIVYTLSELDEVDAVRFFINSRSLTVLDQNGEAHSDGVAKGRFSRFAPRNPLGEPVSTAPLRIDIRGEEEADVP